MEMKSVSIHWESMLTRPEFAMGDMIRQHEISGEVAKLVDRGAVWAAATRSIAAYLRQAHAAIRSRARHR